MPTLLKNNPSLEPLQALLARALGRVEARLDRELASGLAPVQRLVQHVERYRGKMVRPSMSLLAGLAVHPAAVGAAGPDDTHVGEREVALAGVFELIHVATLVHDDVLDEADTRRQSETVNRLHGNEAAVILGDYLFSAAYRLCSTLNDADASLRVARVGMTLCEGELLQNHHRGNFALDEETYYSIVKRKTASLIAVACRLGAAHAGATADVAEGFERFGMELGVAFQIQDDLLDLTGDQAVVGKSLGKDVEKGKLTLPIIHHLAAADGARRRETLALLERAAGDAAQHAECGQRTVVALAATDSIGYARATAGACVQRAKGALEPVPDSSAKTLLMALADAVVNRAY